MEMVWSLAARQDMAPRSTRFILVIRDSAADFLAEKQRLVRRGNLSEATREQYQFVMERVWLPWCEAQGVRELTDCSDEVLERFTDHLLALKRTSAAKNANAGKPPQPLAGATIRTYIRAVRVFLSWARVPKGRYQPPKQPRRIVDTLSRQEIDRLERAAKDERDRLIVRVLADTGIRVSELLGLKESDLRSNSHDRHYLIRVIGKGDKEREVGLPVATFDRLRAFAKRSRSGYIFESRRGIGHQLDRHAIGKLFSHLGTEAGFNGRRVYAHLLRHSYATRMIARGVNLGIIQKAMGHESLAMLATTYSHVTADDSYDEQMRALK